VLARQQVIFDIGAEAEQVEVGGDVQNGQRDPAEQTDRRHGQKPRKNAFGVGIERGGRQRDCQCQDEKRQPHRIFGRAQNGLQIQPPAVQQPV